MNELREYKEMFLNYPRKSIKEMEKLLENNQREEFIKAYMHNIYSISCNIYKMYPTYFENNSVLDMIADGNELIVKLYNRGIRNFKQFTYNIYYSFYIRKLHKIEVNVLINELYFKLYKENGKVPTMGELSKITGFYAWDIAKQDALDSCYAKKYLESYNVEDDIIEYIDRKNTIKTLRNGLDKLSNDEKNILFSHYVDEESLRDIAGKYNCSHENIRKKEIKAVKILKMNMQK